MRTRRWIAAALLLVGCSGGSEEPKPTATGTWTGTLSTQVLTLNLLETGGAITGTGTITNTPTGTRALTATGTFVNPTVAVTLSSGTTTPFNLSATLNANTMTGTLNGSGFTGDALTLTRAPR